MENSACFRILIVEDNLLAQTALEMLLESLSADLSLPFSIDVADTGKEATRLFHNHTYHLIFMDLGLPDTDGFNLCKAFRSHEKKQALKKTPIVALTGHSNEEYQALAKKVGMDDFYSKPLKENEAKTLVGRLLV